MKNNLDMQGSELLSSKEQIASSENGKTDRSRRLGPRVFFLVFGLIALSAGLWFMSHSMAKPEKTRTRDKHPISVTVARAGLEAVPVEIRSIGNVLPFSTVNIVPQVSGQLVSVTFKQGDFVKKGQLLFQIDQSQYQASLAQARGNIARDRALVSQARATMRKDQASIGQLQANLKKSQAERDLAVIQVNRYKKLVAEGAVSREQLDQMSTNLATIEASLEADRKAIENAQAVVQGDAAMIEMNEGSLQADIAAAKNAEIQLGWTEIRAPIDGRTSSLNVYAGNVVTANSATPLVTIAQVKPIYVNFSVPEQDLDVIRANMNNSTMKVQALVGGSSDKQPLFGKLSFLENTVNIQTGTIMLRATFDNIDGKLFPGQFVDVVISIPASSKSVVIPTTALQTSQRGTAVYRLTEDKKAEFVPIKLERTRGDLAAIKSGLAAGDIVVTDGQLQLEPGARVRIVRDERKSKGE